MAALVIVHLLFLHQTGSSNPIGLASNMEKLPFQPYFTTKDFLGLISLFFLLRILALSNPWLLGDPENFIISNPLVTPVHIQPEWYFLFAYAILRSIPNKLGGVIALAIAILILLVNTLYPLTKFQNNKWYFINKGYFWFLVGLVIILTWIGARPVEEPYVFTGQILTILYFRYYFFSPLVQLAWEKALD